MTKYIIIPLLFLSCTSKETKKEIKEEKKDYVMESSFFEDYNNKKKMDELKKKVLTKGDTIAFLKLSDIYLYSEHEKELLYYSIVMAEDYNFHGAYEVNDLILSNSRTKKLGNYYLLKLYETGKHDSALERIKEEFPDGKIPKASEYWDEIN
jgi:hypothetical protein